MSDLQAVVDRGLAAAGGEAADAAMMREYDRVASLFTPDAGGGALADPPATGTAAVPSRSSRVMTEEAT